MNPEPPSRHFMGVTWGALGVLLLVAVIGAAVWIIVRTSDLSGWPALWGYGALGILVGIFLHAVYENRGIRRVVGDALQGRQPLTDMEFGSRFYDPPISLVASRLRQLLGENLGCDLAGMIPSDEFEDWLRLSSGPDSASDSFFEEVAIEFQLTRRCPWPERFGSFDSFIKFVAKNAYATRNN